MKMQKNLLSMLFLGFAATGLLVGCPDDGDDTCDMDGDCAEGFVCEDSLCVETCESSEDCSGDDVCLPRATGEGMICQPAPEPECTEDTDCEGDLVCDLDTNTCVEPEEIVAFYTIEIRDTSTGDSCTDVTYGYNTPGAKPMYAALIDGEDNILGWGTAVGANLTDETDYDLAFEVFDGSAPDFDEDCPETVLDYPRETPSAGGATTVNTNFTRDNVVALGCGGSLFLAFYDENDARIPLEAGYSLFIGEYGPFCKNDDMTHDPQSRDDFYAVYVCASMEESVAENDTCTFELATERTGVATIDVTLPADAE